MKAARLSIPVTGLFVLALLATFYVGKVFLLPLALALLLSFVFRPLTRLLSRCHISCPASALFIVVMIGAGLALGIYSLSQPAQRWLEEAPGSLRQLEYRLNEWTQPVEDAREATKQIDNLADMEKEQGNREVVVQKEGLDNFLVDATLKAATGMFTTLVLLFFILGWGERFYRNLVKAQGDFSGKRQLVEIVLDIESAVGSYLLTITIINILLGVVVGVTLHLLGVPNATLWAVVTTSLNYIPYLGPAITAAILSFVSLLTFDSLSEVITAPLVFLAITTIEGYLITPMAVGKRLTLNPMIIFLSLIFWFALWGFVGALLTVPILVCLKVTLQRIEATRQYATILD